MPRPNLLEVPVFFHNYVNQAPGADVKKILRTQEAEMLRFFRSIPKQKRNYRYAKGKWTLQEVIQHIIDAERVFAYRSLCFARQDKTSLPSFDENLYADTSKAAKRDWADLVEELKLVRRSTIMLFDSFDKQQMNTVGVANKHAVSVLAMGFVMAGHVNHHIAIIRERYL